MSLYDLFTGHFTWYALLGTLVPLLFVAASAFFAGYWRGRSIEVRETEKLLDRLGVVK